MINDDDGHSFIVPANRKKEAEKILDDICQYWNIGDYDLECQEMPEWIRQIDGYHCLTFENPIEE